MKAIKMRIQKSSRWLVILLATVVAIITSIVVANATQTITTPNAAFISYSLASGAYSTAITPTTSKPVLVMGCCNTLTGVGQVTLQRLAGTELFWVGLDNTGFIEGGSSVAGSHIVYIDSNKAVDIQTASADTIRIHNGTGITASGNVTLIW